MTEVNPRHRKNKLEKYIGKNVRVTFKDGNFVEGVLTHHGWKYGMDDCEWYGMDDCEGHSKNTIYARFHYFSFCHSGVKKVDLLVM